MHTCCLSSSSSTSNSLLGRPPDSTRYVDVDEAELLFEFLATIFQIIPLEDHILGCIGILYDKTTSAVVYFVFFSNILIMRMMTQCHEKKIVLH